MAPARPETLPARISAALTGNADTGVLATLYYECYGQPCHQRVRITHFLTQYLQNNPIPAPAPALRGRPPRKPLAPKVMPYQFKAAFADVSVIVQRPEGPKEVTAANLTDDDAALIIADGKGHLLQPATAEEALAALTSADPILSTRTVGGTLGAELTDVDAHEAAEAQARLTAAADEALTDLDAPAPELAIAPEADPEAAPEADPEADPEA